MSQSSMSFPGSFSSQLSSIMEALLKAVVAEVTALVEDGAVELRLELRDRERQILEKERDIEERDRVIEELRAAVEELTARGEEAMSPAEEEDRGEQTESCDWNKDEDDIKPVVKSEPTDEFAAASPDPPVSLWPPPPLSTATDTADPAAACSFDARHDTAQTSSQYSQETEDFSHMDQADQLHWNQEHFYSTEQPGFSLMANLSQLQNSVSIKNVKKKIWNTQSPNNSEFRCNQCGKTFTVRARLITHQSVHTGAKPYSCDRCGKRYSRTDSLARHRKKADACCKDSPGKQPLP